MTTSAAENFSVQYTEADVRDAHAHHWKTAFFGWKFLRTLLVVGGIAAVLYAGIAEYTGSSTPEATMVAAITFFGTALVVVTLSLISRALYIPHIARRAFAQLKEYQDPWNFTVNDQTMNIKSSRGQASLPFSDFVKWSDGPKVFMVYRSDRLFNFIPKRFLSPTARAAILQGVHNSKIPESSFWNS